MRSTLQQKASRQNGRCGKGPVTPEGKLRASRNALKHGALAIVHRPDDESADLISQRTEALAGAIQPRNAAELGIVQSVGRDLVRLQRAESALEAAAQIHSAIPPDMDKRAAAEAARLKKLRHSWQLLADQAPAIENMSDSAVIRRYEDCAEILKALVKEEGCEAAASGMTEACLEFGPLARRMRTPGAEILKDRAADTLKILCLHVVKGIDVSIASLEARSASELQVEEALVDIPDEKLVRRFDRYARATQGAVLRHLQILKELRSLHEPPACSE